MEISCLPVSFFPQLVRGEMTVGDWAALAKKAGLRFVDLSAMFLKTHVPVELYELKRSLESQEMAVKMVTSYPDFSHPEPLQRERELAYLQRDIALASELGAPFLRITAGESHEGLDLEKGIENVAACFKRSADFADRMGVTLVYENHAKPSAWHTVDFSYSTEIFLEIVRRTEDTSIRVNFDTANPVAYADEAEPMRILPRIMGRLGAVHVADTSTKGALCHTVIGTGLVPFGTIFAFLKSHGYNGLLSIEEGSNLGFEGIRRAVEFVGTSWERADSGKRDGEKE